MSFAQHSDNVAMGGGRGGGGGGGIEERSEGDESCDSAGRHRVKREGWHFEPRFIPSYELNAVRLRT